MGMDHTGKSHIPHKDAECDVGRNPGVDVGTLGGYRTNESSSTQSQCLAALVSGLSLFQANLKFLPL